MGKWIVGIFGFLIVVGIIATSGTQAISATWVVLNIIMAIDMVLLANKNKKKIAEETSMKCPTCAETIQREAKVCRFCNTVLSTS